MNRVHASQRRRGLARVAAAALSGAALLFSVGCAVHTAPPPYVEAEYAPPNVGAYPSVVYEGHPNYYVGGRWYYRHRGKWVYYRNEPSMLYRQRTYVQQAPPARILSAPPQY